MTAVDVTCPKCQSKLKLDEAPSADELIECPKCEHQFAPAAPKKELPADLKRPAADSPAARRKAKKKAGKKEQEPGKSKSVKKKKTNPFVLVAMMAGALVILGAVGAIGYLALFSSGRVTEIFSYVPPEANVLRGANVGLVSKYPGYMQEVYKQMAGPVDESTAVLSKACGHDDAEFLDYMVVATVKGRPGGTVLVLRTRKKFNPGELAATLGAEGQTNGVRTFRPTGKGFINGAAVLVPTDRLFVVVGAGPGQNQLLNTCAGGGVKNQANMMSGKLTDAGWKITKGHIWQMVIAQGDMANYNRDLAKPVEKSFKNVADQLGKAKTAGTWMSFGPYIRLGGAFDCDSAESASALADAMVNGPIGKGDESEVPRDLNSVVSFAAGKDFKAYFLSNIKFKSSGTCAFFETKVLKDKAQMMSQPFNNPSMGEGGGGFGGGIGGPPGGPGMPGAGPGGRGPGK